MESVRLFVGIDLPAPVRASLAVLQTGVPRASWVREDNLHITLKFIGEVDGERASEIAAALAPAARRVAPFTLAVAGTGAFPPPSKGQPKVLWVGLGSGHPRLFQLQRQVDEGLFGVGVEPERRVYHPHVTLARAGSAPREGVRQYLRRHEGFEGPAFAVERLTLFRSTLGCSGAVYTVEDEWPLGAR